MRSEREIYHLPNNSEDPLTGMKQEEEGVKQEEERVIMIKSVF